MNRPPDRARRAAAGGRYGEDTVIDGDAGDMISGDHHPGGGPPSQTATIYAGDGRERHLRRRHPRLRMTGTNPRAVVHAHGAGTSAAIHRQSAGVIVYLSTVSEGHLRLRGCIHISHCSVGYWRVNKTR